MAFVERSLVKSVPRVLLGALSVIALACTSTKGVAGTKSELLDEATKEFTYEDDVEAVDGDAQGIGQFDGVEGNRMWGAAGHRSGSASGTERHHFIARFKLDKPYPRLGMGAGYNYVFVDPSELKGGHGPLRHKAFVVVPSDETLSPHYLELDLRTVVFRGAQHPSGRAVKTSYAIGTGANTVDPDAYGICLEGCPSGHCGVTDAGAVY